MKKINIAIDGPSGVGKSTIAKNISQRINYIFINTGLMYRAIAYYCIKNNIDYTNRYDVIQALNNIELSILKNEIILLNDVDVTSFLWKDEISIAASKVASYKEIREFCVLRQKKYAINKGVIMEGRDIGSIVIPDAELKIFLFANTETRANRRIIQLQEKKLNFNKNDVLNNINKRDEMDITREIDPLMKTEDAIEIDTNFKSILEVEEEIYNLYLKRINNE